MSDGCKFCGGPELRPDMFEIGAMPGGTLYLQKDQTHPGRLLFAVSRHVRKVTDLTTEEYADVMTSVYRAAQAVTAVCSPDKINYLVLGDISTHLHIHIVPKYKDGKDWGKVFLTDEPDPLYLQPEEYQARVAALRSHLEMV